MAKHKFPKIKYRVINGEFNRPHPLRFTPNKVNEPVFENKPETEYVIIDSLFCPKTKPSGERIPLEQDYEAPLTAIGYVERQHLPKTTKRVIKLVNPEEAARNRQRIANGENIGYYNSQEDTYWEWIKESALSVDFVEPPSKLRFGEPPRVRTGTTKPKVRGNEVNRDAAERLCAEVQQEVEKIRAKEIAAAKAWLLGVAK